MVVEAQAQAYYDKLGTVRVAPPSTHRSFDIHTPSKSIDYFPYRSGALGLLESSICVLTRAYIYVRY